jgi:protein required for attachment to host cells
MMKQPKTWYLLTDGGRARLVQHRAEGRGWETLFEMDGTKRLAPDHVLTSDRPGRARESAAPARHAIEPRSDAHEERKQEFVDDVIARLADMAARHHCDGLVVAAPPRVLHQLRERLGPKLRALVTDELDKDLAKTPGDELDAHLAHAKRLKG